MAYTNRTRLSRAAEVMRLLKTGPASLAERSPHIVAGSPTDEERKRLHQNYLLWVSTWITPQLEDLIPELRKAKAARTGATS